MGAVRYVILNAAPSPLYVILNAAPAPLYVILNAAPAPLYVILNAAERSEESQRWQAGVSQLLEVVFWGGLGFFAPLRMT